ncbi:hypothetical protein AVEN_15559-1 [Araneus ventricosus]|uniref:Uncharacterized protein n=1 Tax=Araneus ventricosus TaxID=182803 RepID=A0A4Y2FRR3_ARAVE|nr:hypothetical protein AVEN_15559-1 [Araneus ventricosus]
MTVIGRERPDGFVNATRSEEAEIDTGRLLLLVGSYCHLGGFSGTLLTIRKWMKACLSERSTHLLMLGREYHEGLIRKLINFHASWDVVLLLSNYSTLRIKIGSMIFI